MIGYVILGTNDLPRAASFYDDLLGVIGLKRQMDFRYLDGHKLDVFTYSQYF